jgi:hypothetical protein
MKKNKCIVILLISFFFVSIINAREYPYKASFKSNYGGNYSGGFWIYEPENPKPEKAPVIFFVPGWTAKDTVTYGAWFDHLVKSGNIVVWLSILDKGGIGATPFPKLNDNAYKGYQLAVKELINGKRADGQEHVHPDFSQTSIFGHSSGGLIIADIAARANMSADNLPIPGVIFSVDPAKTALLPQNIGHGMLLNSGHPEEINPNTLIVAVTGDKDNFFGSRGKEAITLLDEASQVPPENKYFYIIRSNNLTTQNATHFYPGAPDSAYENAARTSIENYFKNDHKRKLAKRRKTYEGSVVDELDYELWELFDEARAVKFENKGWIMPVIHFSDIDKLFE